MSAEKCCPFLKQCSPGRFSVLDGFFQYHKSSNLKSQKYLNSKLKNSPSLANKSQNLSHNLFTRNLSKLLCLFFLLLLLCGRFIRFFFSLQNYFIIKYNFNTIQTFWHIVQIQHIAQIAKYACGMVGFPKNNNNNSNKTRLWSITAILKHTHTHSHTISVNMHTAITMRKNC